MPEQNVGDETLHDELRTARSNGTASDYHGSCGTTLGDPLDVLLNTEEATKNVLPADPPEVDAFIAQYPGLEAQIIERFKNMDPRLQRNVMAQCLSDARDVTAVLIKRIANALRMESCPLAEDLEKFRMSGSLSRNQLQGKPFDASMADEQHAAVPVDLNRSGAIQRDSLDLALAAAEPVKFRLSGTLTFSQTRWRSMDVSSVSPMALESTTFPLESDAGARDSLDIAMSAAKPSKFSPRSSLSRSQKEWKSLDTSIAEAQSSSLPIDEVASANLAMTQEHDLPKPSLRPNKNVIAAGNSNQNAPKRPNFMSQMSQFARAPKFSFAGRHANGGFLSTNSTAPGPGAYNAMGTTTNKHKSEPSFRFGASNRPGPAAETKDPGPGAYNPRPNLKKEPKALFGTSSRAGGREVVAQRGPGPGAYEVRDSQRGPMFTAAGRRNQAASVVRSRSMPGPGAYSPPALRSTVGKACSFGKSARSDVHGTDHKKHLPGPGAYTSQIGTRFGSGAPGATLISRRGNGDLNDRTPGPGDYNTQMTSFGY